MKIGSENGKNKWKINFLEWKLAALCFYNFRNVTQCTEQENKSNSKIAGFFYKME